MNWKEVESQSSGLTSFHNGKTAKFNYFIMAKQQSPII